MKKTSATIAIDQDTGPVSAENQSKDTHQEVIEDQSDPDQDLHQDQSHLFEEKELEKDLQLNIMTDKAFKDLYLKALH